MKNKKAIYILVPLVTIIWGLIVVRMLDFKDDSNIRSTSSKPDKPIVKTNIEKDTFSIVAKYRDPFLGTYARPKKKVLNMASKKVTLKKKSVATTPPIIWPKIEYQGIIKNQKSNKEIAILTINNQEALLAINNQLMGVTLKEIFKDSIRVSFNRSKKVILKNE